MEPSDECVQYDDDQCPIAGTETKSFGSLVCQVIWGDGLRIVTYQQTQHLGQLTWCRIRLSFRHLRDFGEGSGLKWRIFTSTATLPCASSATLSEQDGRSAPTTPRSAETVSQRSSRLREMGV